MAELFIDKIQTYKRERTKVISIVQNNNDKGGCIKSETSIHPSYM